MTDYLLYDSTVKLSFNPGSHRYRVSFKEPFDNDFEDGTELRPDDPGKWTQPRPTTGVTTILNVMNKGALVPWAAKLAANKYAEELKKHKDESVTVSLANSLVDVAKNAHNEARDKAGDMGTAIHEQIENFHKLQEFESVRMPEIDKELPKTATSVAAEAEAKITLPEEVKLALKAYIQHWNESGFKALMIEQIVYSKKHDFAGTLDQVVETPDKRKILRDVKTTKVSRWAPKGAYVEMFAQMGGYAQALQEMFDWLPDELEVINVGKDGVIRRTSNKDFGMSVDDAIHYWNSIYTTWYTNKDWEYKFKRS